jgi:hypothetical protein
MGDWKTISVTNIDNALPPPGDYQAAIIEARVIDKPNELWLQVTFGLRDHAEEIRQLHCIACSPTSDHRHRVTDGKRALVRLLEAGKLALTGGDPAALPKLLKGAAYTLTIAHKTIDGVPELTIRNITPSNPEA